MTTPYRVTRPPQRRGESWSHWRDRPDVVEWAAQQDRIKSERQLEERSSASVGRPYLSFEERVRQRMESLEVDRTARTRLAGQQTGEAAMVDGAAFILDTPFDVPAVWGRKGMVAWAQGEALLIAGGSGVGKTTLAAQVVRARLGLQDEVLGLPVAHGSRRVLYLAMDRPAQARRALARLFTEGDREAIADRLRFRPGPPPADAAQETGTLLRLAQEADADTLVVDSVKDAAIGLSEDGVGAGYNRARQACLAAGIEVLELHHNVKRGTDGKDPSGLADVYGSTWLTAGAGSVIGLYGEPGAEVVKMRHLKQPVEVLGPWVLVHDHATGVTTMQAQIDLVALARETEGGITAREVATALAEGEKVGDSEIEAARRRLKALERDGALEAHQDGKALRYRAIPRFVVVDGSPHEPHG